LNDLARELKNENLISNSFYIEISRFISKIMKYENQYSGVNFLICRKQKRLVKLIPFYYSFNFIRTSLIYLIN